LTSFLFHFLGLVVEPGKNYSQEVPNTFKLTMASLGTQTDAKASRTTLIMKIDEKEDYSLCSLTLGKTEQQPLELVFAQGEQISFQVEGNCSIHLTGYYLDDAADDFIDDEEEEEDDGIYSDEAEEDSQIEYDSEFDSEEYDESCSEEECTGKHGQPRIKRIETDESDLSEDEEFDTADEMDSDEMDSDEEIESDEMSSEDEKVDSTKTSRSVHFELPDAKKVKEAAKPASIADTKPATKPVEKAQQLAKEVETMQAPLKKVQPQQPAPQKAAPVKKTLPSGLQIEDLKLGNGTKVTQGKTVLIHYKGTLTNGKVFDSSHGKKPLSFKVGKSEVIKGMDMGIMGMNVGGSRKLVIPGPLAYGNQAVPGIPKNSTLIFEIRVEKVF
jgi:FK506-binding nuclear protein